MNTDISEGKWKQIKGKVKQEWGELTDDDLDRIEGKREQFVGIMQERAGVARDEAEKRFEAIKSKYDA